MKFSGSALYMTWVYSGGTVTLSGDQRSVNLNPAGNKHDVSAGSDAQVVRIAGMKDFTASIALLPDQTTYIATEDALVENTEGTLYIAPWGTASGARKYTCPAISSGPKMSFPYNEVVEMSCDFEGFGALSRGTY